MVRRFYITGGNNEGDPLVNASSITDPYIIGKTVTGVFKEECRYFGPNNEWTITGDTISVLNGTTFQRDEVFIVEVGPLKTGTTCSGTGIEVEGVDPYLPDIMKCIVARVNTVFETRDEDPFSVHYDRGLYNQVGNDRLSENSGFYIVWLVMPFAENSPDNDSYYADATCELFIAAPTDSNYSQQQREDINFYPRLVPIYRQLIEEIKR